jgi:hypothetical protein
MVAGLDVIFVVDEFSEVALCCGVLKMNIRQTSFAEKGPHPFLIGF